MKNIKLFISAAALLACGAITMAFVKEMPAHKPAKMISDSQGFAVVELFTSEGCSSCPSADAVIAKIEKEVTDQPVYVLAYHVDYWNRLGWKDVFSSADYSRRQSTYANWLNLSSVYTPQVIVNGKTEFVGSQEGTLRNAIKSGLQKTAKNTLALSDVKNTGSQVSIKYNTSAAGSNNLLVALIQKSATSVIKNGENGGRTLHHVQIVSNIKNLPLNANTGVATVALPQKFSAQDYEVIAFVQNSRTGEISAATRTSFPANFSASN